MARIPFTRRAKSSGFVLKYRLATGGYHHPAMLQGAARALRTVRGRAAEWKLDPRRIGIMGSSAGGHLANAAEVQAGHRLESPQVQAAHRLLVAFEHSPMASFVDFRRIDVSNPEVLTVTTSQGSELTFGLTNLDQQLRRWREIYELGQKIGKAIATLDLAVTNYLPATWLEASAVAELFVLVLAA